jgi:hypothetical protein
VRATARDVWQAYAIAACDGSNAELLDPMDHVEVVTNTLQLDGFEVTFDEVRELLATCN